MSTSDMYPGFFADVNLHVGSDQLDVLRDFVRNLEGFLVGARRATAARTPGAFVAYDFHVTPSGPRLIEVNTNAGGAFLCLEQLPAEERARVRAAFVAMLRSEWTHVHPAEPLRRVAIVDENPTAQFLYPEFLLIQQALVADGLEVVICDPRELEVRADAAWVADARVDLVYNRLTDFYFREPAHAQLIAATQLAWTVMTPAPAHHALFAHKANLVQWSDPQWLRRHGASDDTVRQLTAVIPRTVRVTAQNADELWPQRRTLFFKPVEGFASRGAYRGEKLTRGVWQEIVAGDYIAQDFVPAPTVLVGTEHLKYDLRVFTYRARPLLLAARLYQGQTTNFRTPGGGFARVLIEDSPDE